MSTRRITKVKVKNGAVEIHLLELDGKTEKESTLKSAETPSADLDVAMAELVPVVYDILALPRSWRTGAMRITGVSFSFSEETEVEGAVITGRVDLETSQAPFNFNTPHLPFDQYSAGGQAPIMPASAIDKLEKVRTEAKLYIDGKRAQMELALR
jgi:hypothetical protein